MLPDRNAPDGSALTTKMATNMLARVRLPLNLWNQTCVQTLILPLTSCRTVSKSSHLSEPPGPHS